MKMKGKSLNIKRDRLSQLKELFPEIFAEDKVDWEKLKAALGEDISFSNERYRIYKSEQVNYNLGN